MRHVWQHLHNGSERRLDYRIDEYDLRPGDVRGLSIIKQAHREAVLFLEVTLCEELHKEEVSPQATQLEVLRRVRNVGHVEDHLD